ncbi:MAG TPA: branched-chain amino acid transport system II carrier protein, partial [Pseudomonas sp.]|nr:branched-chain amino acid transport system II carrier protein [Pseudomonas sp.]
GLGSWVPALFTQLPLADQSMGWLVPVLVMLVLAVVTDRLLGRAERVQHRA